MLIACLGPFLNKAIHTDDVLFVWTGQWIQKHPADFFGFTVNWWFSTIPMWLANYNPPFFSYFLAGVASLLGWNEIALHLACLGLAILTALGIHSLARNWCGRPLLATLAAILTPAFLVSSTTLMCDVMMLGFWVWTMVLWDRALATDKNRRLFVAAGVLAALAILTKYSAVTVLPLLAAWSILKTRKAGGWLLGLAIPMVTLACYEWVTRRLYGHGLFSTAVYYAHTTNIAFPGGWRARTIVDLTFIGGSLLPAFFFIPRLWRRREWLAGSIILLPALFILFRLWNNVELNVTAPGLMKNWTFVIQAVLLTAAGLHLLLLVISETFQSRNQITWILILWIVGVLCFATMLNWTVNVRSFLPIAPALAILLMRRMETFGDHAVGEARSYWPLVPAAAVAIGVAVADCQLADSARTAARKFAAQGKTGQTIWFEGHSGLQYYLQSMGGVPLDVSQSQLQPGDTVVVPENGTFTMLPAGSVNWAGQQQDLPFSWMNVMGWSNAGAAGFYGANLGPVPFLFGRLPFQKYTLLNVLFPIHFHWEPSNPQEVRAGALPAFNAGTFDGENHMAFEFKSESAAEYQLATRNEAEGKISEAIQHYRNGLAMDTDNPMLMNNLAWLLATADPPELRNGREALPLAMRAVNLTDGRIPRFLQTLAAACAETGRFPEAIQWSQIAASLAWITGQEDVRAANYKLLDRYSSGRTAAGGDSR